MPARAGIVRCGTPMAMSRIGGDPDVPSHWAAPVARIHGCDIQLPSSPSLPQR
jgi:hypothetical protein